MTVVNPTRKAIINGLQGGFPLTPRPFRDAAAGLGLSEGELIEEIGELVADGQVSRFGPLWNVQSLGGAVCLAAMAVPAARFEEVAGCVNAYAEVAHNYERDHELNMWFVVAAEDAARINQVFAGIERQTGLTVWPMPKTREFFVGFRVEV
ncbi:MAG: Lrp/AsnC family transcriptional regulator [Alphaproteobacteria bacterium]|nr:Lrp/AsnC family transcriptional regulator [Alphaproteobacteria bacterium]